MFVHLKAATTAVIGWWTSMSEADKRQASQRALTIGGEQFSLTHARGETEDQLWVWVPSRLVVASADYSFPGSLTHTLSHGHYSGPWRAHEEFKK